MRGPKKEKFEGYDREKKNVLEAITERTQYQNHIETREEKFG